MKLIQKNNLCIITSDMVEYDSRYYAEWSICIRIFEFFTIGNHHIYGNHWVTSALHSGGCFGNDTVLRT